MIAWRYLNKQSAAINALRDYENMQRIVRITPDEIKAIHDGIASPRSAALTGMPRAKNNHAGEDRLCKALDRIEVLSERYKQAAEFLQWFEPAWDSMDDTEQLLLTEFYVKDQSKTFAYVTLAAKLNYEERHLRRLKDKALEKLSLMLYGK